MGKGLKMKLSDIDIDLFNAAAFKFISLGRNPKKAEDFLRSIRSDIDLNNVKQFPTDEVDEVLKLMVRSYEIL